MCIYIYIYSGIYVYINIHIYIWYVIKGFPGVSVVKNLPANEGAAGDVDLIPGLERCPGGGTSNLFQYSCLGNPMDRGGW